MTWVYIQSERPTRDHPHALYTVGHYAPDGTWHAESDYSKADDAAERVSWLNGNGEALARTWGAVEVSISRVSALLRSTANTLRAAADDLDAVLSKIKRGVQ